MLYHHCLKERQEVYASKIKIPPKDAILGRHHFLVSLDKEPIIQGKSIFQNMPYFIFTTIIMTLHMEMDLLKQLVSGNATLLMQSVFFVQTLFLMTLNSFLT